VWLTGQDSDAAQRAGRYLPATLRHPSRTLPAIASRVIAAYSRPGDTVLDLFCGTGTSLVEAVYAGRDAIGIEYHPRWAALSQANLRWAGARGAKGRGFVRHGDARSLLQLIPWRLRGEVDLIVTTPPMRLQPTTDRYRQSPSEIATRLEHELFEVLLVSTGVLRAGGHIVLTTHLTHRAGHLIDLTTAIAAAADQAGLLLVDRAVALREPVRNDQLRPRRGRGGTATASGSPAPLTVVHEDVLVYRLPDTPARISPATRHVGPTTEPRPSPTPACASSGKDRCHGDQQPDRSGRPAAACQLRRTSVDHRSRPQPRHDH
jgi:SAM-dependent methyltransferase